MSSADGFGPTAAPGSSVASHSVLTTHHELGHGILQRKSYELELEAQNWLNNSYVFQGIKKYRKHRG